MQFFSVQKDTKAASDGIGGKTAYIGHVRINRSTRVSTAERGQHQSGEFDRKLGVPPQNCTAGEWLFLSQYVLVPTAVSCRHC